FADLLNANFSGAFSDLDIGANFSAGGLAYDGSDYQLLLESDDDRLGGSEVFMVTFESFADLLTANFSGAFSDLDIGVSFSAGGLAYQLEMPPDPAPIPVPGTLALLAASFLGYRFVSGARRPPGN
ncbi:MAG: hypothetical protein QNJ91_18505, partial [Gammaproteobacteria bacterium]|nr:hypothetical protein [Gammaproteobacteria bacterium]